MSNVHLHTELLGNPARVVADTKYGPVKGGRARNGAAVFLEVPYALNPGRFEEAKPLPSDFRYENECLQETSYAVQPTNDGQAAGEPYEDKVGLGKPSENPLFLNIVSPPSFPEKTGFPVKIYIHGGFLQFGSPHSLSSQAQYISAEHSEVWVNIGHRLSVFGFLACDDPKLDGNFGFKDQWHALLWVRENIAAFGGNPDNVQLTGLSAGAYSIHQLLHHVSRLPDGQLSPFKSAVLQSNAIVTNPKSPSELRPQFQALCKALRLDPTSPSILPTLRDPKKVPWQFITHACTTSALEPFFLSTFRGCLDRWLGEDLMEWQRSGGLARGLKAKGVKSIVIGDLKEEWYLYSIAHHIRSYDDILPNLERYYPTDMARRLMEMYAKAEGEADSKRLFGEIFADGQVHLPVRMLARDLQAGGMPVVRYEIRWTPENGRRKGYVTHGSDRSLWAFRIPSLTSEEQTVARGWLNSIDREVKMVEEGTSRRGVKEVLTLNEDKTIGWREDTRWGGVMRLLKVLDGEKEAKL